MPKPICKALFGGSPYAGAELSGIEPDLHGWGSTHPIFETVLTALRPTLVIEVGTWKGASAVHMAEILQGLVVDPEIVCIDTWLGPPIAWVQRPKMKKALNLRNGYPQLYYTFIRNVIEHGLTDVITPLPAASEGGYYVMRDLGATAKVIYIDAGHQYESVKSDYALYLQLLEEDGILIGDDFGGWPDVKRAVIEVLEAENLFAVQQENKIAIGRHDIRDIVGPGRPGDYVRQRRTAAGPIARSLRALTRRK